MRDYESIYILNPTLDEAESEKITARMQEVVAGNGGEVVKVEKWGKRKLAYTIGKHKKGEYVLLQFKGEPATVAELERNYKMTDAVIKFLTVKLEKEALAHLALQAQQQAQAESLEKPAMKEAAAELPAEAPAAAQAETAEAPEAGGQEA